MSWGEMESYLKGIAAFVGGVLVLFWRPGLETAQDSTLSALSISGQVVTLVWLGFIFAWVFAGALIGHSVVATVLFYLRARRKHLTPDPYTRSPGP